MEENSEWKALRRTYCNDPGAGGRAIGKIYFRGGRLKVWNGARFARICCVRGCHKQVQGSHHVCKEHLRKIVDPRT